MRIRIVLLIVLCTQLGIAQSPAVDIESSNSGLLLPRLVDTASVSNPEEGLLIYDLNAKEPAFYNGNQWNSAFVSASQSLGDSITYTVSSPTTARMALPLVNGTYPLFSFSWGMSRAPGATGASYSDVSIQLPIDANWIPLMQHIQIPGSIANSEIEIDVFASGAATPYYSLKMKGGLEVTSTNFGGPGGVINVTIAPGVIGFMNHTAGTSWAFDLGTGNQVSY